MKTSAKGISLIKKFESYSEEAYMCPAGVLTIGWGHTAYVKPGQKCTLEEAELLLRKDLRLTEDVLNALETPKPLNQNQFDALASFVFNVGPGNFSGSALRRKVLANPDDPRIKAEFARWIYSKGKALPGLVKRREEEADLYFSKEDLD